MSYTSASSHRMKSKILQADCLGFCYRIPDQSNLRKEVGRGRHFEGTSIMVGSFSIRSLRQPVTLHVQPEADVNAGAQLIYFYSVPKAPPAPRNAVA